MTVLCLFFPSSFLSISVSFFSPVYFIFLSASHIFFQSLTVVMTVLLFLLSFFFLCLSVIVSLFLLFSHLSIVFFFFLNIVSFLHWYILYFFFFTFASPFYFLFFFFSMYSLHVNYFNECLNYSSMLYNVYLFLVSIYFSTNNFQESHKQIWHWRYCSWLISPDLFSSVRPG